MSNWTGPEPLYPGHEITRGTLIIFPYPYYKGWSRRWPRNLSIFSEHQSLGALRNGNNTQQWLQDAYYRPRRLAYGRKRHQNPAVQRHQTWLPPLRLRRYSLSLSTYICMFVCIHKVGRSIYSVGFVGNGSSVLLVNTLVLCYSYINIAWLCWDYNVKSRWDILTGRRGTIVPFFFLVLNVGFQVRRSLWREF